MDKWDVIISAGSAGLFSRAHRAWCMRQCWGLLCAIAGLDECMWRKNMFCLRGERASIGSRGEDEGKRAERESGTGRRMRGNAGEHRGAPASSVWKGGESDCPASASVFKMARTAARMHLFVWSTWPPPLSAPSSIRVTHSPGGYHSRAEPDRPKKGKNRCAETTASCRCHRCRSSLP